jgi:NTE family protein
MKLKPQSFGLSLNAAFFGFFAHAGFMKGLEEEKLVPKFLTGCSAGSIIASLYSKQIPMNEVVELIQNLKKENFWEGNKITQILKPLKVGFKNYSGALTGSKLRLLLKPYLKDSRIEDLKIKLGISVANLTKRKRELLTKGNLLDAVVASSAFPLMFEVQKIGEDEFTDGGLVDHEPIKEMILDSKIKKIITHHIISNKSESKYILGKSISNGLAVIESETDQLKKELAKLKNKKIHRIISNTNALNENNFKKGVENISIGYESFQKYKNYFA